MDWRVALSQTVLDQMGREGYGAGDCCQFAAAYYRRMTGEDPAKGFDYASEVGANRLIAAHERSLEGVVVEALGRHPDDQKSPGDVCVAAVEVAGERGVAAGVISDGFVLLQHPVEGILRAPLQAVLSSWSCPAR